MMANMRNIHLQKLKNDYPDTQYIKEGQHGQEYRVGLKLSVSASPLYIKITIGPQYPYTRPIIAVMSRVSHPYIDSATYSYNGPSIKSWSENS